MDLYLLRHAEAGEAPLDEDRELTERGRGQVHAVVAGIEWLDLQFTAILSSPLPRAVQTAQPIADALAVHLETVEELAPGNSAEDAVELLDKRGDRVLLVGHEPQLSGIAQTITGGRLHMRKAMIARLELDSVDPARGDLAWLLSWRHMGRLGRG
jgi:phosphohistidine phosphatase